MAKLNDLKKKTIKKRTESKMCWGVKAYQQWRMNRLNDNDSYDAKIFDANLECLGKCYQRKLRTHAMYVYCGGQKKFWERLSW